MPRSNKVVTMIVLFVVSIGGGGAFADPSPRIVIEAVEAPYAVRVNSATNPEPFRVAIHAVVPPDHSIEYSLDVCSLAGCFASFPFQDSPEFDVMVDQDGVFRFKATVRILGEDVTSSDSSRQIFVYPDGPITPPNALQEFRATARGIFAVTWPSESGGSGGPPTSSQDGAGNHSIWGGGTTQVVAYDIILTPNSNTLEVEPIVERLYVPDSVWEPRNYTQGFSLFDSQDSRLGDLIRTINEKVAETTPVDGSLSRVTATIQVLAQDGLIYDYMPLPVTLNLYDELPHVVSLTPVVDLPNRTVRVELGEVVVPENGFFSADVARVYHKNYGTEPGDYWEIHEPMTGDSVLLVDNQGAPVPPGALTGPFLVNIVDEQGIPVEAVLSSESIEGGLGVPQCWDGIDNDGDGLVDFDDGDPDCDFMYDLYEYENVNDLELAARTLVIYNENAADARQIAEYYALRRGIDPSHICPITVAPGHYAAAWELEWAAARIRAHICERILEIPPGFCGVLSNVALAERSPITHLVIIKGIPARLYGTPWGSDQKEPSFDYYLAYSIYNDGVLDVVDGKVLHGLFDGTETDGVDYQPVDSIRSYIRQLDPARDRMVAYGRIEAITTARTLDLIDRTIQAERAGPSGKFLVQEEHDRTEIFDFLADISSTHDPINRPAHCHPSAYILTDGLDWPHNECRAGTTFEGIIPGEPVDPDTGRNQSIPYAVNAGIYVGQGLPQIGGPAHDAFSGFANMINWRRVHPDEQASPCTPLCADLPTQAERTACRAASTDFFGEINTDCVGVAPGMLGWQLRSWPVQYYGFTPHGWTSESEGATEKIMPHLLVGDPEHGTYAHFGALDAVAEPVCVSPPGVPPQTVPCLELIAIDLASTTTLDEPIPVVGTKRFRIGFDYRRGGSETGRLVLRVAFHPEGGGDDAAFVINRAFDLVAPQPTWTHRSKVFNVPERYSPIVAVTVQLIAKRGDDIRGWLDLDNITLTDDQVASAPNLIPEEIGAFESVVHETVTWGDWAPNVIDRLGGVAWWGSSSHHVTGGFTFVPVTKFLGAFYAGRTLGESLSFVGSSAVSGIIYGDPLYRPAGVKIYLGQGIEPVNDPANPYRLYADEAELWQDHSLVINAFHGQADHEPGSPNAASWRVSMCPFESVGLCDQMNAWTLVDEQHGVTGNDVNGVFAHPLNVSVGELVDGSMPNSVQNIVLRLRVWIPSQETVMGPVATHNNDLTNYAYFRYIP